MTDIRVSTDALGVFGPDDAAIRVSTVQVGVFALEQVPLRVSSAALGVWCVEPLTAGCTTSIATCWKIVRTDGITKRFTTHDRDLAVPGDGTYKTCRSVEPSAVELAAELQSGGLDVAGIIDSAEISEDDLRSGRYDFAAFSIFRVDWADLTRPPLMISRGRVGKITFGRQIYEAVLRTPAHLLQQKVVDVYTPECRVPFGSAACGVALASHTFASTVTSVTDRRRLFVSAFSALTGLFQYGKLTFTTGANGGFAREIKAFSAGHIELWEQLPFDIGAGDGVSIHRGCDKTPTRCNDDYANIANYRGFPHVPGNDAVTRVPDARG